MKPEQRLEYQASIDRPRLVLPNGKRVAVFIVVNVENWDIARAMPRQVLTAPQGASVSPDLPNWAWHEYGMRVGFWRLKAALDAHGIAPSMTINGTVPAAYPRVTQAARDAGWEFMGHGFRQIATHLVEDQRAMIRDAIAALREAAGHDIVGWLAPGLTETLETPDLLAEAGIRYCADWVVDDLPCTIRTAHGPMLTMPYSVELNDIPMMMIQHHAARGAVRPHGGAVRSAVCGGRDAGCEGDGPRGASLYQRRAASHRLVRAGAGLHGGEARHAVLAGAADHGLVSEGDGMNWGVMSRAERDAAYDNVGAVTDSMALRAESRRHRRRFAARMRNTSICATGSASATCGTCFRRKTRRRRASCSSMAATGSATARSSSPT